MSVTTSLAVNDIAVPDNPEIQAAVQSATAFFEQLLVKYPEIQSDDRTLSWQYVHPTGEGAAVWATYEEHDRYGTRSYSAPLRLGQLTDPVLRKVAMQDLLREVVHQRSGQISKVLDRLIQELDEGADGQSN